MANSLGDDCSKHVHASTTWLLPECGKQNQYEDELLLLESVGIHILSILDDLALPGAKFDLALAISAS